MTETRHAYLFKGVAVPCLLALADMSLFVYNYSCGASVALMMAKAFIR